jgi:hypothetical protein
MPVIIPEPRASRRSPPRTPSLGRRLAWFATLYVAGVGAVGLVAYGLRLWIKA